MDYLAIKYVHVTCVTLSISLFVLRGALQFAGVAWRQWRVLRIAPHVIDTLLLTSAIWLAIALRQYPFVNGWLTAKVLALCAYVCLGRLALQTHADQSRRLPAFAAALLWVTYIVGVAMTHSPGWGFLHG